MKKDQEHGEQNVGRVITLHYRNGKEADFKVEEWRGKDGGYAVIGPIEKRGDWKEPLPGQWKYIFTHNKHKILVTKSNFKDGGATWKS